MRKVISRLDEGQRVALLEWADFSTAVFSAALIVEIIRGFVDLLS